MLRILESKRTKTIDLGKVTWFDEGKNSETSRLYMISAGVGMDALVCKKAMTSKMKKVLHTDGEYCDDVTAVCFECLPAKLRVLI